MLTDPTYTIPPVPAGGPAVGIRWLRRTIARFTDGPDHTRRRRLITEMLATVDVRALRDLAAERTRVLTGRSPDLVARIVPVEVLGQVLDFPPVPVEAVAVTAAAYQPGTGREEPADEAVAWLVEVFGGVPDELTAAKISVLVQAYAATAGLIRNAARAMRDGDETIDAVLAETLRNDPPVRATRRVAAGADPVIEVDLAANGIPFGAGPHQCPGRAHAMAIVAGVLAGMGNPNHNSPVRGTRSPRD
ncbi:hypothetical protein KIPE111705_13300 [Kibdelosporangium persicum]|uniref:Oxidoreductase n=2 Tax=Kibdelosporangium persicum TaxID=2698649 RepID=A0ABX2F762_9PSEU|nr:hypothetical protein [Kibdelosporangium persicum]NRN67189.1 Oxidoreductase [Kibdelosporangium persicum]